MRAPLCPDLKQWKAPSNYTPNIIIMVTGKRKSRRYTFNNALKKQQVSSEYNVKTYLSPLILNNKKQLHPLNKLIGCLILTAWEKSFRSPPLVSSKSTKKNDTKRKHTRRTSISSCCSCINCVGYDRLAFTGVQSTEDGIRHNASSSSYYFKLSNRRP